MADGALERDRGRRRTAHIVVAVLLLISTRISSVDQTAAEAQGEGSPAISSDERAPSSSQFAVVAPTAPARQQIDPAESPRMPRQPSTVEQSPWTLGGRTFAAEFLTGLGSFAYDPQWGCGFGKQSDFMGDLRQVAVAQGIAAIRAERARTPCGRDYASAVMSTRGEFSQRYGYFEARIRFDAGTGLWPAFWMQPADGSWPPEIDIMEAYPNGNGASPGPTSYMSSLHYGPGNQVVNLKTDLGHAIGNEWHTYGVDWRPDALRFTLDGQQVGLVTENIPDQPMYLILDLAIGSWSALADGTTPDRAVMEIDWVRAYR